jgi:hypothetical protein
MFALAACFQTLRRAHQRLDAQLPELAVKHIDDMSRQQTALAVNCRLL